MESMVRDMTRPNPPDRPSVGSIITRFTRLRSNLRPNQLKRALSPKASSDPLRDHLRSLGISRDPLEPDPGLNEVEEEDSDDPTLGLRTTSSGETHDSGGSAAAEDYWDSEVTRRSVSTAATSPTPSPIATSPPPVPGIGSVFSQWLPGRPKSPVALRKGAPTPILVPQNPMSPSSQGDILGGGRGPLPFFARSLSPDSVPPSPSSPTSPINIHHHRKGSSGGPTGTLAFLKTGKFPWTVSESPSSRASTPDIDKFKLESDFMAYAANGVPGNNSASPTSPGNSWSKAMNGLHGFMGGKKKGRERSNSKLSISSDTVPWAIASAAASASAVDMANWGSNPEDAVAPPPSNPTPPSGGLAAFWGLGKSSSSPPVKKEKKPKSMSMPPAPNAAAMDIPKPDASSSTFLPLFPAANGTFAEVVPDTKPSSKASTAKPTPASTPPSTTPAPITKLSKKANKRASQSATASAPVPTPITEEDLPPKASEEEEWTPGSSSISPPTKGVSPFWGGGKEEKKKKKAERAGSRATSPPTIPAAATHASFVTAMADTWTEEPEGSAPDMSRWVGEGQGFGFGLGPDPTLAFAPNATAWSSPFSVPGPGPERSSPRTGAPPISTSQLGSASSSSKATPTTSGQSTPALSPAMPVGRADKRSPVSNHAPVVAKPLAPEENPDAGDWMAFTNRTKTPGLRPSKLGSSVISAAPEKSATPAAGTTSGWAAKQGPPKQESSAWGAFGASPTDSAFQTRMKAKAPEPTKKSAQVGGAGPQFGGGWGSISTPVQQPIENTWDTWSVRSVPAIEVVSSPTASPASKGSPPSRTSPPMPTWKPAGSSSGGGNTRTATTMMDTPSTIHTARSSWTSLVKEPHGFNAAQWKMNGSGSTLGPVSEGFGEKAAMNDVWEMEMGSSGAPSDSGAPWQGEISPELLRSLQGPTEYSSGSDKESRKRKSEIGSGLRRPESGFKSAFAGLSDSGEEKGKSSLVPNRNPLNNVSDSSSSRSSWSAFPKKATSSPPGFGLSKSPPAAPAVIASTAMGKTAASATGKPTSRMPGGFMSWDDEDGEPKDVDLDHLIAMAEEPRVPSRLASSDFLMKNGTAAPPKAPGVSMPAPTQATKAKRGKKGKYKVTEGFDEEGAEPEPEAPTAPESSAVYADLLAQLDHDLQPHARPSTQTPPSPYKTRTRTVWIEDEVPTRTGSLEKYSIPNPVHEREELEKAKKLEEEVEVAMEVEEEKEKEKEKEKEETTKGGGGNKKGNNNNNNNNNSNRKGKKKR